MIHVTQNAIDRYISLVGPVSRDVARAEIAASERAVELAVRFGAHVVKTAKAKLILQGHRVVTVEHRHWIDHIDLSNADRAERIAEYASAWA